MNYKIYNGSFWGIFYQYWSPLSYIWLTKHVRLITFELVWQGLRSKAASIISLEFLICHRAHVTEKRFRFEKISTTHDNLNTFGVWSISLSIFSLWLGSTSGDLQFPISIFSCTNCSRNRGHFLFGYAAVLFSRNVKIGVMTGLIALTIDFDHLLSAVGLEIETRLAQSIPCAIMSCRIWLQMSCSCKYIQSHQISSIYDFWV